MCSTGVLKTRSKFLISEYIRLSVVSPTFLLEKKQIDYINVYYCIRQVLQKKMGIQVFF